jgi:tetratricopeptide (TPR) repeat protein
MEHAMSAPENSQGLDRLAERAAELERTGEWSEAAVLYNLLAASASAEANIEVMTDALRGEARVHLHLGQYERAVELARQSLEAADRHDLTRAAARAINLTAALHYHRHDLEAARNLYNEALERARAINDDELIGLASMNLGVVLSLEGEAREARLLYLECIAAAVRSGDRTAAGMAYNNLGLACTVVGEWAEASIYFDRGLEIAERIGDRALIARLQMNRADPLIRMGHTAQAAQALDRAEALAGSLSIADVLATTARLRGAHARVQGDRAAAAAHLERALDLAAREELRLEHAEALEALARLQHEDGRHDGAIASLRQARSEYAALGALHEVRRTDEWLARWTEPGAPAGPDPAGDPHSQRAHQFRGAVEHRAGNDTSGVSACGKGYVQRS